MLFDWFVIMRVNWSGSLFEWGLVFKLNVMLDLGCMTKIEVMVGKDIRESVQLLSDSLLILFRKG